MLNINIFLMEIPSRCVDTRYQQLQSPVWHLLIFPCVSTFSLRLPRPFSPTSVNQRRPISQWPIAPPPPSFLLLSNEIGMVEIHSSDPFGSMSCETWGIFPIFQNNSSIMNVNKRNAHWHRFTFWQNWFSGMRMKGYGGSDVNAFRLKRSGFIYLTCIKLPRVLFRYFHSSPSSG